MTQKKLINGMRRRWILLLIPAIVVAAVVIIMTPWNISNLSSLPHPAQSYTEAVQRVEILRAQEPPDMAPVCHLKFMTHDKKADRAIILVHGYTNCPQQFYELGQHFYELGYNVLIAPLPQHGLADRMTEAHAHLKAEELAAYADETVDIAQGLGGEVIMMGLSAGGVATAWAAQHRSDIDVAVIISPAFGFKKIPTLLTAAAMNIHKYIPNSFGWWDPVLQADRPPPYAYPRYSTQALRQILRLGFATQADAKRMQPAAKKMVVVFNVHDNSINNALTMDIVEIWKAHNANLITYEFDANLTVGHDLIDPTQPDQQIDIVYPLLIDLVKR
ncbi:alpha/beta hydrolase [Candidatus Omnitrophota bacterium]